jgi:thymidylate synthase ThyX
MRMGRIILRNSMNKEQPVQINLIHYDNFDEKLISQKCMEIRKGQF